MTEQETVEVESDAQIAKRQGVTRQAIVTRRQAGWTQEEIEKGERKAERKSRYDTEISRALGMSVAEAAAKKGVTPVQIYREYRKAKAKAAKEGGSAVVDLERAEESA